MGNRRHGRPSSVATAPEKGRHIQPGDPRTPQAGLLDAGTAISGMRLISFTPKAADSIRPAASPSSIPIYPGTM
jgi:hypothetical protein